MRNQIHFMLLNGLHFKLKYKLGHLNILVIYLRDLIVYCNYSNVTLYY